MRTRSPTVMFGGVPWLGKYEATLSSSLIRPRPTAVPVSVDVIGLRHRGEVVQRGGREGIEVGVRDHVPVTDDEQAVDAEVFFRDLVERGRQGGGVDALRFGCGGSPLGGGEVDGLRVKGRNEEGDEGESRA